MRLRSLFGVEGPRFNAEKVLEDLALHGVTVDVVDDHEADLPRGIEACWIPETATMIIRLTVYLAACQCQPRALFTVAHELGHLALEHRRIFCRDSNETCERFEDSEWQANTFAAEFLMPLDQIKQKKIASAKQISMLFGVSKQAAEVRFKKLVRNGEL